MTCTDFNLIMYDHSSKIHKGANHEQRSNCLLTDHGPLPATTFQVVRRSIQRRQPSPKFHMSRSVLLHDFCSTDSQRVSARYRSLPSCSRNKTLSRRPESQSLSKHSGESQRTKRLQNLSRHCSDFNRPGSQAIYQPASCYEPQTGGLRFGFNCHRPMPVAVPMGPAQKTQKRRKDTYSTRSSRQYSSVYPRYRRPEARCTFSRSRNFRGWSLLYHGQGLHRFPAFVSHSPAAIVLCNPGQKQSGIFTLGIPSGQQKQRSSQRLYYSIDRAEKLTVLSRTSKADSLCRYRTGQAIFVLDQQLQSFAVDDCAVVQVPLAGRTVFQMDKTASSNQSLLRHHTQCGQDTGLDSNQCLCSGCDSEKGTRAGGQHVRDLAGFRHYAFRENTHKKPVFCGIKQFFKERFT